MSAQHRIVRIHGYVLAEDSMEAQGGKRQLIARPSIIWSSKSSKTLPAADNIKDQSLASPLPADEKPKIEVESNAVESNQSAALESDKLDAPQETLICDVKTDVEAPSLKLAEADKEPALANLLEESGHSNAVSDERNRIIEEVISGEELCPQSESQNMPLVNEFAVGESENSSTESSPDPAPAEVTDLTNISGNYLSSEIQLPVPNVVDGADPSSNTESPNLSVEQDATVIESNLESEGFSCESRASEELHYPPRNETQSEESVEDKITTNGQGVQEGESQENDEESLAVETIENNSLQTPPEQVTSEHSEAVVETNGELSSSDTTEPLEESTDSAAEPLVEPQIAVSESKEVMTDSAVQSIETAQRAECCCDLTEAAAPVVESINSVDSSDAAVRCDPGVSVESIASNDGLEVADASKESSGAAESIPDITSHGTMETDVALPVVESSELSIDSNEGIADATSSQHVSSQHENVIIAADDNQQIENSENIAIASPASAVEMAVSSIEPIGVVKIAGSPSEMTEPNIEAAVPVVESIDTDNLSAAEEVASPSQHASEPENGIIEAEENQKIESSENIALASPASAVEMAVSSIEPIGLPIINESPTEMTEPNIEAVVQVVESIAAGNLSPTEELTSPSQQASDLEKGVIDGNQPIESSENIASTVEMAVSSIEPIGVVETADSPAEMTEPNIEAAVESIDTGNSSANEEVTSPPQHSSEPEKGIIEADENQQIENSENIALASSTEPTGVVEIAGSFTEITEVSGKAESIDVIYVESANLLMATDLEPSDLKDKSVGLNGETSTPSEIKPTERDAETKITMPAPRPSISGTTANSL